MFETLFHCILATPVGPIKRQHRQSSTGCGRLLNSKLQKFTLDQCVRNCQQLRDDISSSLSLCPPLAPLIQHQVHNTKDPGSIYAFSRAFKALTFCLIDFCLKRHPSAADFRFPGFRKVSLQYVHQLFNIDLNGPKKSVSQRTLLEFTKEVRLGGASIELKY